MTSVVGPTVLPSVMSDQLDLIWQMGVASLTSTGNELRIPLIVSNHLTFKQLKELENRLSEKFDGAGTIMFPDPELRVYRICVAREGTDSLASIDMAPSASSPSSVINPKTRVSGKKSKIPRPPNAFILYRQKYHSVTKAANPDMHNNEISSLIGKQWRCEDDDIKDAFRLQAEKIKLQHAIDNPGYQYTPRKPADKKRRMTARKLAQLNNQSLEISDFAHVDDLPSLDIGLPSLTAMLGVEPTLNDGISFPDINLAQITLPSAHGSAVSALNFANAQLNPASLQLATNNHTVGLAPHVNNNHDFLNSLIDWDGIEADLAIFHGNEPGMPSRGVAVISPDRVSFDLDMSALNEVDTALPYFNGGTSQAELDAFQRELSYIGNLY